MLPNFNNLAVPASVAQGAFARPECDLVHTLQAREPSLIAGYPFVSRLIHQFGGLRTRARRTPGVRVGRIKALRGR